MLKGAHASAGATGGDVQFVDLMTYVNGKLQAAAMREPAGGDGTTT